ncbi:MAG: phosphatase [Methanobrevibacter sp.]|uniref:Ppx/GppA phosphatase family protein n=1 Tax=Methanobrevibacter sp. TaxID=66852 RepID=UPI0026E08109|nr:phosphatase [Methanobrevibacter sp.]MDO5849079.1 phosphatase [Methanobrevibacter sp.]
MLYGIVDIGSNTVRLNIYDIIDDNARFLLSKKYALGLVSYIRKGKLTDKGISKLANVLEDIKADLNYLHVENFNMFATASLRNISNSGKVLNFIRDDLDLKIEVLDEKTEGKYSFLGSISIMDKATGVLIDVGGGSSEVVLYKHRKIKDAYSLPIGSLSLFNDYVGMLVPTESESKAIVDRVRYEIERQKIPKKDYRFMCAVGGSVRAILKLSRDLKLVERKERIISPKVFELLREELPGNDKETYSKLLASKPARIHTMIPGLLIIQELCSHFNVEEMQVSKFGVREGYLNHKLGRKDD